MRVSNGDIFPHATDVLYMVLHVPVVR